MLNTTPATQLTGQERGALEPQLPTVCMQVVYAPSKVDLGELPYMAEVRRGTYGTTCGTGE